MIIIFKTKTYEFCPHCENEVKIPSHRPSPCPKCKEVILPCSACPVLKADNCNWSKNEGCNKFPKGDHIEKMA